MTNVSLSTGQDWDAVNAGKTVQELDATKVRDLVTMEDTRFGAGGNTTLSERKLEKVDEVGKIAKVDKSLCKAIMQARTAKKMTQKDLATAINVKPQVMAKYETGKAVPDPQMIVKLERKLGCKLPRPGTNASAPKKAPTTGGNSRAGSSGITDKQATLTTRQPSAVSSPPDEDM